MKDRRWFPVVYMFIITACFSAVIIGFAQFTEPQVQANQARAFELAVLTVLPDMYDENVGSIELHRRFEEELEKPNEKSAGAYVLKRDGKLVAYALPFTGQGFWAPIDGVIGISADKETVTDICIYQQRETPGLGAEVAARQFCDQFIQLKMGNIERPVRFKRMGEPLSESDVHAVTGATQTSTRLEVMINTALSEWRKKIN